MLLCLPQRPEFPIRHLLSFADFFAKQLCGNFCKANLIIKLMYFHVVTLNIYEVCELLVETHWGEELLKHLKVTVERETNAQSIFIGEDLSEDVIQLFVARQSNQVY